MFLNSLHVTPAVKEMVAVHDGQLGHNVRDVQAGQSGQMRIILNSA